MSKKLLTTALFGFCTLSFNHAIADQIAATPIVNNTNIEQTISQLKYGPDYVIVGNINVSVTDTIKMVPDTAEFSITYLTQGATPSEASNRNANNMKVLTTFMELLGITKQDLVTLSYRNYQNKVYKEVEQSDLKQHQTDITVNATIAPDKFLEAVALLEKNNISNIRQQKYNNDIYYSFMIHEIAVDADTSKKLAQEKLKNLEDAFKTKAIAQLSVAAYTNQAIGPQKKEETQYYVQNTIKVKVKKFENLGKIIAKAQSLKMTVNNDMNYSISDEARTKLMEQAQTNLFEKLTNKATRLLGHKSYQLGTPKELYVNENDGIRPPALFRQAQNNMILNAGQSQLQQAANVEIQTPSEFEITISLNGNFDIIKPIFKK